MKHMSTFAMELQVLCFKAYKFKEPDELEDIAKQQFILGVKNNIIRERIIVHCSTNTKDAIENGRLLEVANRIACGEASPNVRGVFADFLPRLRRDRSIRQIITAAMLSVNERTISLAVPLAACKHKLRFRTEVAMWRLMDRRRASQ